MTGERPIDILRIGTDADEFERFYRAHVRAIERFVARRLADAHAVADLTADVFLAAIDGAAGYRPDRGVPVAWLYGIARNVVAAHARRGGRALRATARLESPGRISEDSLARLEERIDAERSARHVYAALDLLADEDRQLFEHVALDGLAIAEAAALLGLAPATARKRMQRARAVMRNHLEHPDESPVTTPEEVSL